MFINHELLEVLVVICCNKKFFMVLLLQNRFYLLWFRIYTWHLTSIDLFFMIYLFYNVDKEEIFDLESFFFLFFYLLFFLFLLPSEFGLLHDGILYNLFQSDIILFCSWDYKTFTNSYKVFSKVNIFFTYFFFIKIFERFFFSRKTSWKVTLYLLYSSADQHNFGLFLSFSYFTSC